MNRYRFAIVGMAAFLGACAPKSTEKKETDLADIPVVVLHETDTALSVNYVADIQASRNVEVRARMQGFVERIAVDEGQKVRQGQLLFKMSDKEFLIDLNKAQASLSSAQSAVKIAEVDLERIKTLVQKKVISPSELQLGEARLSEARAKVSEARAQIDDARQHLSYTSVRAPFDGIIDRIPFKSGSLVSEGSLLTTLSDNRKMYAYFDVSENEYLQFVKNGKGGFEANKESTLVLADGSVYPLKGRIETQESSFSDGTGSIAFRAVFPNPDQILKHGASGKIRLRSELGTSLLVPQKSVFEIQDKNYVFVVGKDNRVTMKSFVPQMRLAEYFVVRSGLKAGDKIVYEGVQNIRDGAKINPVSRNTEKLLVNN
ncbi:efflux transporter periplasmic adaptor subunit [Pedobacter yulinensis]|uniref:Efflux transporter periplasmic adaptor subunit n=1 Tax=Pedobacter yulinensis TaxID=2126353 RepID=A0A2T3HPW3_9SPHI|nr:efflux RND transporter periplasmic adaptor subunit [Pedobacter yulinensis]PST84498.1 efflux transporter periplasmic adaptor subunit [Pedobacter yulinensis]